MGLESTAACLKEECGTCHYPIPEEISGVKRGDINNLLQRFDEEDETGFLKVKSMINRMKQSCMGYIHVL